MPNRSTAARIAFFPKSAWSYVDNGGSLSSAARVWTPTPDRPFAEGADPAYRLAWRGRSNVLGAAFAELALRVLGPVRAARVDAPDSGG